MAGGRAGSALGALCISALLVGCAIERRGLEATPERPPSDGGQEDGATTDAAVPPPFDGAMADDDAGPGDAGSEDAGPEDAGPTADDAGSPDAGSPPSCDSSFGGLRSYQLCEERATECEFYARLDGSTCAAACGGLGRTCLGAFDNKNPAMLCHRSLTVGCSSPAYDLICICSR